MASAPGSATCFRPGPPRWRKREQRMKQALHRITIETRGRGLLDVTENVRRWVAAQSIGAGLLTIYCRLAVDPGECRPRRARRSGGFFPKPGAGPGRAVSA